jgi:saccharopine dehydrogenase-like NADP-dependent oxidoreductase
LVTASYVSDAMQELDGCKENNLIFMNEIGLDPGVDHMSAMKVIDEISDKGGKCFYSNPLWGSCCTRVRYQSLEL